MRAPDRALQVPALPVDVLGVTLTRPVRLALTVTLVLTLGATTTAVVGVGPSPAAAAARAERAAAQPLAAKATGKPGRPKPSPSTSSTPSPATSPTTTPTVTPTATPTTTATATATATRTPAWSDEFSGASGTSPDSSRWGFETGGHGWGNDELQSYTDRPANASMDGNGSLVITARRERWQGADGIERSYTSARLFTKDRFEFRYGTVEARIKVADGQGIWPAFWMLGYDAWSAGWPESGEMDIMETFNETRDVYTTVHGPSTSSTGRYSVGTWHPSAVPYSADFHVYGVRWAPELVEFMIDGRVVKTVRPTDVPAGGRWVFDKPNYLLLNVAVGGWAGPPDTTTAFPRTMLVDWVRVYR